MMPAGTYYIGDLCYCMHDEWDEFCELTINDRECLDGEFNLKDGRRFATYGTAYGDGTYAANVGGDVSVDAGLIGCILVSDIKDKTDPAEMGIVVTFDEPFETSEYHGLITFGHVKINTDYDDSDDTDYLDSDEDE